MKNKPNPIRISGSHSNGARGFTLVELLVVITIIAVLAALTMTVTQKIRARAQQANAMSSLRQIGAFSAAYSAENNGDINTLRWDSEPKTEGPKGGNTWTINTFWGRFHDYLCPEIDTKNQPKLQVQLKQRLDVLFNTDTGAGRGKDSQGTTFPNTVISGLKINSDISGLAIPISFNENLHEWNEVVKVSSLGNPSQILYATFGSGFFDVSDGKTYVPRPSDKTKGQPIYFMTDKKALVVYLDGHVESISAPIPDRNFK